MSDKTKARRDRISRRRMLYGAGVVMALPWLESMSVFGADISPATGDAPPTPANAPPKRLAALFMANGINSNHWTASGSGADMTLGKTLAPMEPLKSKMNFITGLFNKAATGVG